MINKAPGAVVCAHCKKRVGVRDCALCKRIVCKPCAASWATCKVPHAVELRLGVGKRLRRVDRYGRYGLVTGLRGRFSFVDLHEARWLPSLPHVPTKRTVEAGVAVTLPYPVVTSDGGMLHWGDFYRLRLSSFLANEASDVGAAGILDELVVDYRERYAVGSRADERVVIVNLENGLFRELEPVQRKVVQTVACDGTDRILCTGSYGLVHIDRFRAHGTTLRCLGTLPVRDSDIAWIAVASRRVAVASMKGSRSTLRVFKLRRDLAPEAVPVYRFPAKEPRRSGWYTYGGSRSMVAALSPDGRYVAMVDRGKRSIHVHDTKTGDIQRLGGHSDKINLVRFTAQTRHIVSADYDNRVLIRPRHEGRFVTQKRKLRLS